MKLTIKSLRRAVVEQRNSWVLLVAIAVIIILARVWHAVFS